MQQPVLQRSLLELNNYSITGERILFAFLITTIVFVAYRLIKRSLHLYIARHEVPEGRKASLWRSFQLSSILIWAILILLSLGLDKVLLDFENFDIKISNFLQLFFVLLLAKMADDIISSRIAEEIIGRKDGDSNASALSLKDQRTSITKTIQYSLIAIVLIIILPLLHLDLSLESLTINDLTIDISLVKIISAVLFILVARVIIWLLINILLFGWYRRKRIDHGKQYAYNQLLTYVIYVIAFIIALQYLGFNLTLMWASAAAILVGVAFALQQTISDFFSGLILLFERSVEAGDFLDFGAFQGTVKKIGLRASVVESLERKDIIIPNSKLVNESVTNWTKGKPITRFDIQVGVAYGSDTALVKDLLLEVAVEAQGILLAPKPFVRFLEFGDSSLLFGLYFFSMNVTRIEDIKSDIRFRIDATFRKNKIEIPFPQRDIWIKKGDTEL